MFFAFRSIFLYNKFIILGGGWGFIGQFGFDGVGDILVAPEVGICTIQLFFD